MCSEQERREVLSNCGVVSDTRISRSSHRAQEEAKKDVNTNQTPLDKQVAGTHYKEYSIQPIEFAMCNRLNACQTNILKYIMRYKLKGTPREDLEKAKHYIDLLIQLEGL